MVAEASAIKVFVTGVVRVIMPLAFPYSLLQGMMVGCIPVVIADEIEFPFENTLDW